MKLYYSPGACSRAPHIALNELGIKYDLEKVNLKTKEYSGGDYRKLNPKGYVPALELDNGEILTEAAAILQYLADLKPDKEMIPKAGTPDRYREQEWLNYISTELHKGFSPLFHAHNIVKSPEAVAELKAFTTNNLAKKFDLLAQRLQNNDYLMGAKFTVADAYLFTILSWTKPLHIDMSKWPALMAYVERVGSRPEVAKTVKAEEAASK
jgi:glutathione S-transferase